MLRRAPGRYLRTLAAVVGRTALNPVHCVKSLGLFPGGRGLRRADGAGRRRPRARALGQLSRHRGLRDRARARHSLQLHRARVRRHPDPVADAGEDPPGGLRGDVQPLERGAPGRARSRRRATDRPQPSRHHPRPVRARAPRAGTAGEPSHHRLLRQPPSAQGIPVLPGGVPPPARSRVEVPLHHHRRGAPARRAPALHRPPPSWTTACPCSAPSPSGRSSATTARPISSSWRA